MASSAEKKVAVAILAAGRGERAGHDHGGPKQYRLVGGNAVITRTIKAFSDHPAIGPIAVAVHRDDRELFERTAGCLRDRVQVVEGGTSRQESALAALRILKKSQPDFVMIHDGVRPFVDHDLIGRILDGLDDRHGAVPALPVSDTLKRAGSDGMIVATEPRQHLYAAQTPQAFPFAAILAAHEKAEQEKPNEFTDDSMLAEWAGIPVRLVAGSPDNVKLTWAKDIEMADRQLSDKSDGYPDVRTGNGYDVHAFGEGDHVMLCGVEIPHSRSLVGHSDADVGLHALTDALLATIGAGDIGTHFPPSDPRWRDVSSGRFVTHATAEIRKKGGRIANVDITIIAEEPKIGPHRSAMIDTMAEALAIAAERVSVKATTNERLGFVGRREGIAAFATATVVFPGVLTE